VGVLAAAGDGLTVTAGEAGAAASTAGVLAVAEVGLTVTAGAAASTAGVLTVGEAGLKPREQRVHSRMPRVG
jgi:hypothetical protein